MGLTPVCAVTGAGLPLTLHGTQINPAFMNFASRITRLPRAFNTERGAESRACMPMLAGDLAALVEGAGGCSPYLSGLIEKEADWLASAIDAPEDALKDEFDRLRKLPPDQLSAGLRQGKRRVALLTALADLAGVWSLEHVTGALTDLADLACDLALKSAVAVQIKRGKPAVDPAAAQPGFGQNHRRCCPPRSVGTLLLQQAVIVSLCGNKHQRRFGDRFECQILCQRIRPGADGDILVT